MYGSQAWDAFNYLSGSHLQSQVKSHRLVWIGQIGRDVIGRQDLKLQ